MATENSLRCVICGGSGSVALDLGLQPFSNRYRASLEEVVDTYRALFLTCTRCKLFQLLPPSLAHVSHGLRGVFHNEPEGHLDDVAEVVCGLPGLSENSSILGVSYKELSTLARLERKGFRNTRILFPAACPSENKERDIATIQDELSQGRCASDVPRGSYSVIIARHILEHAHDPTSFCKTLLGFASPGAYIVFEVPDCTKIFERSLYCFLWEEHILYFTEETLLASMERLGFEVISCKRYPYALEDSLVVVVTHGGRSSMAPPASSYSSASFFSNSLSDTQRRYKRYLSSLQERGKVALFGIGHNAIKALAFYELGDSVDCLLDDTPEKLGRFVPTTVFPIQSSERLRSDSSIKSCLLGVSPESEIKMRARLSDLIAKGLVVRSLFSVP